MNQETAESLGHALLIVLIIIVVGELAWKAWKRRDRFTLSHTREVKSGLDDFGYRVHSAHGDIDQAADIMAQLNLRAVELMRHLRNKYVRSPSGEAYPERRHATLRLLKLYNPDNLVENSPLDPDGDTSYTIDKGAVLAFCLREKDPAQTGNPSGHDFHDMETLTFVALHELTHIAITDQDHPPRFWKAFKFILGDAVEANVIRGRNYAHSPTVYCGMDIDYNPLYDQSLTPIV